MTINNKINDLSYFLNAGIKREIHFCQQCKSPKATIISAHYPGKYFCTIGCLWKYDMLDKKIIRHRIVPSFAK